MKFNSRLIISGILVFLVLMILLFFVYVNVKIIGYKTYGVDYVIGDHIGINLDGDAVHFGTARGDMVLRRGVVISSDIDVLVKTELTGIDYVAVKEDEFILLAGEKKELELVLELPPNIEKGTYTGELKVIYLRP